MCMGTQFSFNRPEQSICYSQLNMGINASVFTEVHVMGKSHFALLLDEAQAGIKIAGINMITSDMQMTPPLWQKVKKN